MSFTILGTGSCVPSYTIRNEDLTKVVDTSDEWITSRTGIKERHIVREESLLDITETAANRALQDAGTDASELDLIICTTMQGDYITPSLSCLLQAKINATCPAMDINAACSGFLYALDVAASYLEAGRAKKILVVSAEQLSKFMNWNDRSTCVLFGDAAGAVVLTQGDGLLYINVKAKGRADCLNIPVQMPNNPFFERKHENKGSYISMNGQEIYKFAVMTATEDTLLAAEKAGVSVDDINYFLFHQANGRIIEAARNRLKQPHGKFPTSFERMGNTSSASIPVLLDELNRNNQLKKGDLLLMSAFGAGLTSGVCIFKWDKK